MKKLLLLNVFLITALNGMNDMDIDEIKESVACGDKITKDKTPAQIIKLYGGNPDVVSALLISYYAQDELGAWHDAEYNNLMHLAVGQFIDHWRAADGDQENQEFHADYKYLLKYLHQRGVQVNECNDHHQTPIFLLYEGDAHRELRDYLETKLGAKPTYVSLQPEIRRAKKIVKTLLCCCPWGPQEDGQHEKIE